MTKWICEIDGREYESEEEAREAVLDHINIYDFKEVMENGGSVSFGDIIKELQRLESPLYYKLLEEVEETTFQDYFYEEEEEEDED